MIADGWYLACPVCCELSKGERWGGKYETDVRCGFTVIEDEGAAAPINEKIGFVEDYFEVYHKNKKGKRCFLCLNDPSIYLIRVEQGKIIDAGEYYRNNIDKLRKVAEANNLQVSI